MKPDRDPVGARLWAIVAATVRPFPGRTIKAASAVPAAKPRPAAIRAAPTTAPARPLERPVAPPRPPGAPGLLEPAPLEPGRHRRVIRGRDPLAGVIDLHGLNHDQARATLTAFILGAHADGRRTILVITGKGALGDGVLRRRAPDWLAQPPLRSVVAGLSEAHRRHGGEGALYVALKRR